ncbi:MAG: single-stranded DNA-binding protein [Opitutae bacterium]|nr:single-stranded DNA-binding protein [Opitutae bacterium]|tara:strand:+ start:1744 stop:2469 length:726 start_codon:yes stop_codon:yes gene_type:complete
MTNAKKLAKVAIKLSQSVGSLSFDDLTSYIYNPLEYAWEIHRQYLELAGVGKKKVIFLGMNPGPFGMAQTGVPFGEISSVRDWMGLKGRVKKPIPEHPKRPVDGLSCSKSEVSGRRLWGLFSEKFPNPKDFFEDHFVANYCPLVFMEESGRNRTPDKLPAKEKKPLQDMCDWHLREIVEIMEPEWLIGVGGFAKKRAEEALTGIEIQIGTILHPSPASPAANRGWAVAATKQLIDQSVWNE